MDRAQACPPRSRVLVFPGRQRTALRGDKGRRSGEAGAALWGDKGRRHGGNGRRCGGQVALQGGGGWLLELWCLAFWGKRFPVIAGGIGGQ